MKSRGHHASKIVKSKQSYIGGGGAGAGGPQNIGNVTENWFGKIFWLVIVYK